MVFRLANTLRNDRATEIITALGTTGRIRFYDGAKPAKGDSPAGTLLADVLLGNPAGTATAGVITFDVPRTQDEATASGTPTFFILETGAGAFVADGDVGTEITVTPSAITIGVPFTLSSLTITEGND